MSNRSMLGKKMLFGLFLASLAVLGLVFNAWGQENPVSKWLSTVNPPKDGAGSGESPLPPTPDDSFEQVYVSDSEISVTLGSIKYTVLVDKTTLKAGEKLRVTVSLTNIGSEAVNLSRSYPGFRAMIYSQKVDPRVSETLKSLVWASDYGMVYPMVIIQVQLKPGASMSETFEWNLKDNNGLAVAPGTYYLYAGAPQSPVIGPIAVSVASA